MSIGDRLPLLTRLALALFRAFPNEPDHSIFKHAAHRPQSEYDDELIHPTNRLFQRELDWLRGKDVLDLGSGFGGRTVRYAELGTRSVAGVEVSDEHVDNARRFAGERGVAVNFRLGSGEDIPFPDGSFDLIVMNDVMEHVIDPVRVLAECRRVLRAGGELAVTFPPYYSLAGGSHLHGYATWLPGLNLVFPTRALRDAADIRNRERGIDAARFLRDCPTDKLRNQNGLTASRWERLVRESGFRHGLRQRFGLLDHRLSDHAGWQLAVRMPFFIGCEIAANLPLLREAFCSRIADVLAKR